MATVRVRDLDHLAAHLRCLAPRANLALIRGRIIGADRADRARRLLLADPQTGDEPTIAAFPHHWIGLDIDGIARPNNVPASDLPRCAELAIYLLPGEFRSAACIVQATAGHGIKPGIRLRLWFWAERAVNDRELTRWLRRSPVDSHLFNPIQLHYTGQPIFPPGMTDHLPSRIAIYTGTECVETPSQDELAPPPQPVWPVRPLASSTDQRITKLLTTALVKVSTAREGELHCRLRAAAFAIGGCMDQAGLMAPEIEARLMEACRSSAGARANPTKDLATIKTAIAAGRVKPMDLTMGVAAHG